MAEPFIGQISMVGFNFAPKGYALCNGQLLSISQNTALFSILGTFYGGNGTSTFALPDLRSRAPIHTGQGAGLSPYVIGQNGGTENVTLLSTQMPQHSHTPSANSTTVNQASPAAGFWGNSQQSNYSASASVALATGAVGQAGSSQPHSNIQPYLTINFVIALVGIFPSRN
ncbi:MAG: tail fiber protein [Candidatus Sulfotelmatobacter sp.]